MKNRKQRIPLCIIYLSICTILSILFASNTLAASDYSSMRMSAGSSHTLLIDAEGNIWAFGNNSTGQLGDGSTVSKDIPVMVYSKNWSGKAMSVAAGNSQSLALLEDGTVLMWGYGSLVQKTAIPDKALAIAAGGDMCMAILQSGEGVCWNASSGTLPIKIQGGSMLKNIKEVAAGSDSFLILRAGTDGSVYQLHISSGNDCQIASKVAIASDASSESLSADSSSTSGSSAEYLNKAVSISAGNKFGVALLSTGEVYTWGTNTENGVLGQGTFTVNGIEKAKKVNGLTSISKISAGTDYVIAVNTSGGAFGWGNARNARLDAAKTGSCYSLPEPLAISGISQFDCGNGWNILVNSAGEFYTWGNSKPQEKLTLKQGLLKIPAPSVTASLIEDQAMTISWNPQEFYTEMATGFMVTYTMPDGTMRKTQILPVTVSQITLRGLQAATNYKITLNILGKTGFEEAAPTITAQTAKADEISSTASSTVAAVDSANEESQEEISSASSSGVHGKGEISSLFSLIMIVLIILILAFAVIAFFYIWKRLDKSKVPKIKPVRVSPDTDAAEPVGIVALERKEADAAMEDMDTKTISEQKSGTIPAFDSKGEPDEALSPFIDEDKGHNGGNDNDANGDNITEDSTNNNASYNANSNTSNNSDNNETSGNLPEGTGLESEEEYSEDDFLTRLPDPHEYGGDEDDFIIRRPGEPQK